MHKQQFTQADRQHFEEHGFVRLGKIISDDSLHDMQQQINNIMLGEVQYPEMMMQLDSDSGNYGDLGGQTKGFKGATLKYRKIEQLEQDPVFLHYLKSPIVDDIAHQLIGDEVTIYRTMFMNKPAHYGTLLPWHQDAGEIWGLDRDPYVTLWLALDPANKQNGCVQIIPGSHKLGLLSSFGHTISEEQEAEYCRKKDIVYCELEAGEAFLLHNLLLHRSDKNHSDQSRRALSVCLMDAATQSVRDNRSFPKLFGKGALQETILH